MKVTQPNGHKIELKDKATIRDLLNAWNPWFINSGWADGTSQFHFRFAMINGRKIEDVNHGLTHGDRITSIN